MVAFDRCAFPDIIRNHGRPEAARIPTVITWHGNNVELYDRWRLQFNDTYYDNDEALGLLKEWLRGSEKDRDLHYVDDAVVSTPPE